MKKQLLTLILIAFLSINMLSAQTIRYVTQSGAGTMDGTSWVNAAPGTSLQATISNSPYGSEVWVAKGTYLPTFEYGGTGNTYKTFRLKNGLKLYGGFSGTESSIDERNSFGFGEVNATILSGDHNGDDAFPANMTDNSRSVLNQHGVSSPLTNDVILDGFIITGGYGGHNNSYGAGINLQQQSLTIQNCVIRKNLATTNGGGIFALQSNSIIENCIIENNRISTTGSYEYNGGAGIVVLAYSNTIIQNSIIRNNTSQTHGGGLLIDDCKVKGCAIYGNTSVLNGGGVYCLDVANIEGNTVYDNAAQNGAGVYWKGAGSIVNNTIHNNSASNSGGGLYIHNFYQNCAVVNNTIANNRCDSGDAGGLQAGGGLFVVSSSGNTNIAKFKNNIIANNYKGSGTVSDDTKLNTYGLLESNGNNIVEISNGYTWNATGDITGEQATLNLATSLSGDEPQVLAFSAGSVAIDAGSWGTIETTDVPRTDQRDFYRSVTVDIGSYEYNGILRDVKPTNNILYITPTGAGLKDGSSWSNALDGASYENGVSYLQWAINNVSSGDQIWVAAGTYKPTDGIDRTISFTLKEGANLYGGFAGNETVFGQRDIDANSTILSGDIGVEHDNSDNSYHVVYCNSTTTTATKVDGFTIKYGYADLASGTENLGAGVYLGANSAILFRNCIFTENESTKFGGGLYMASAASLEYCVFSGNTSGSGGGAYITNGTLKYNTFTSNTSTGSGGGLFSATSSSVVVYANTFQSNMAQVSGGGVNLQGTGSTEFTNNTVAFNNANTNAGGVRIYRTSAVLTNNTVVYNHCDYDNNAVGDGGGVENSDVTGVPLFKNNLIARNYKGSSTSTQNDFHLTSGSQTDNGYNLVEVSTGYTWSGTGDITGEQASLNIASSLSGHHPQVIALQLGSVAINVGGTGTNGTVNVPTLDQQDYNRTSGGTDLGASEYGGYPSVNPTDGIVYISPEGSGLRDGSSWENAFAGNEYFAPGPDWYNNSSFINRALTSTPNNTQFWFKKGIYYIATNSDRDRYYYVSYTDKLYGGFAGYETTIDQRMNYGAGEPNETILSGDIDGVADDYSDFPNNVGATMDGNSVHIFSLSSNLTSCLIDGFTLSGAFNYFGDGSGLGGAMFAQPSSGTLQVSNCNFMHNIADRGAGIYIGGSSGNLSVTGCAFENNKAQMGGGLYASFTSNSTIVDGSTFKNNIATDNGGGLYINQSPLTVKNSTIERNTSGSGGGIALYYLSGSFTVLTNNTFAFNKTTMNGSAIIANNSSFILTNNTIVYNTADSDSNGSGVGAVIVSFGTSSYYGYLKNNIIAQNFRGITSPIASDYYRSGSNGTVTSNGGNIIESGSPFGSGTGDYTGTQANLNIDTELSGSAPQVIELLEGSIAINNGLTGTNNTVDVPAEDQRGFTRGVCPDIGAYEFEIVAPTVQATSIILNTKGSTTATLSWTNGDGIARIVAVKQTTGGGIVTPVNGTTYNPNSTFGQGDIINDGFYTVFNGTESTVSIDGLSANTRYLVKVIEYNGCPTEELYLIDGNPIAFTTKLSQTVTFGELSEKTYGDSNFSLSATASSGLTVTFSSSDNTVATVSGTTVTIVGAGECFIYANQAGNATYDAAPQVERTQVVNSKTLTVTGTNADKVYDGTTDATITGASLVGKVGSDDVSLDNLTGTFAQATVGTNISVTPNLTLAGADADNYTLQQPTITANISQKQLTIEGNFTVDTKIYDGNTDATIDVNNLSLLGVIGLEDVSLMDIEVEFTQITAGYDIEVDIVSSSLDGVDKDNYSLTLASAPTSTGTIGQKELSIGGTFTALDKEYDSNSDADIDQNNLTLNGVVEGDDVSLTNISIGFDTWLAGENIDVTIGFAQLDGDDKDNYSLTLIGAPSTTATITPKELTIGGSFTADDKVYDGNTNAAFTSNSLSLVGVVNPDLVYLANLEIEFSSVVVAEGVEISIANAGLTGDDAGNYSLSLDGSPTTTANITPKELTMGGTFTANSKVYDRTKIAEINMNNLSLVGVIGEDVVGMINPTFEFTDYNVGTDIGVAIVDASLDGVDSGNYSLSLTDSPTTLANITAKELTIGGTFTANNKIYNGDVDATINDNSLELVGIISPDDVSFDIVTVEFAVSEVANNILVSIVGATLAGDDKDNYSLSLADLPSSIANITARELTVSGLTGLAEKVYDRTTITDVEGTPELENVVVGDEDHIFIASITANFDDANVANNKEGTVYFTLGGDKVSNYTVANNSELTGNILPRPLTITANSFLKTVGTVYSFTGNEITVENLVTGDAVSSVTLTSEGAAADAVVDDYDIIPSDAVGNGLENYDIAYVNGTLHVVDQTELFITGLTVNDKVYDTSVSATISSWGTLGEIAEGDAVTLDISNAIVTFDNKNAGAGKPVTITGLALSGADAGNYFINNHTTQASISAKPLTLSEFFADSKVYDGTISVTGTGFGDDRIEGDLLTFTYDAAFADKNVGDAKTVNFSGISISGGADINNYSLSSDVGTAYADITTASLTVINAISQDKVYDGSADAIIVDAELDGVIGEDAVTLENHTSGLFAQTTVGNNIAVSVSMSITGDDAPNYTLSQPNLVANITPKELTVIGLTAIDKIYDGNTDATLSGGSLEGVIGEDDVSANIPTFGTFAQAAVGENLSVSVAVIVLEGDDMDNYTLEQPEVFGNIEPRGLVVEGLTVTEKVYDRTADAELIGGELIGMVEGDIVSATMPITGTFDQVTVSDNIPVTFAAIELEGAESNNYTLTQPILFGNITPKEITVVDLVAEDKQYDGTIHATISGGVLSGVIVPDDVTAIMPNVGSFAQVNVGENISVSYTNISLNGVDKNNYFITQPEITASILPKSLTITANNITKSVGTMYEFTGNEFTSSEMVMSEEVASVTLTSDGAELSATIGTYPVIVSNAQGAAGTDLNNYSIEYVEGVMDVVDQIELHLSGLTISDKIYDGTNIAVVSSWGVLEPVTEGHDVTLDFSNAVVTFNNKNVGLNKTVTISGLALTGANAEDYFINNHSRTASISAYSLTLSNFTADDKVYDATTDVTGTGFDDDRLGNDVLYFTYNAEFESKVVGENRNVNFTNIIISSGTDKINYALTSNVGYATATITAKELTIGGTFSVLNKNYDGTTNATIENNSLTLLGVLGEDEVDLLPVAAFTSSLVGENIPVILTEASTLIGDDSENYLLSLVDAPTTIATIYQAFLLTLNVNPVNSGSVVGEGYYVEHYVIDIVATASEGYQFVNWTQGETIVSEIANFTYTMPSADVTLTANFEEIVIPTYTLTLVADPENSGTVTGAGDYEEGEEFEITATANEGFQFVSWTQGETIVSEIANFTYTMPSADVTLTANFEEIVIPTYTLTLVVDPVNSGTVTGAGDYEEGEEAEITATATEGFQFVSWTEGETIVSEIANFIYTMPSADITLTANFEEIAVNYTVTFVVTENSVAIEGAIVSVNGENLSTNTEGIVVLELEDGVYPYTVSKEGFVTSEGSITVDGEDVVENVSLIHVGVDSNPLSEILVYPNPFRTSITINNASRVKRVVITNLIGQRMMDIQLSGTETETISADELVNGIYLIQLYSESGEGVIRKMVKE